MKSIGLSGLFAMIVALGCSSKTDFKPREFSDEEKKKIQMEDKAVADEESQGSNMKKKKK